MNHSAVMADTQAYRDRLALVGLADGQEQPDR
jgi:hypothetical protein